MNGIEGATVRAIAKEAGYTPGALYAYYSNKDDILADLLCRSLGQAARAVRHHVEAGDQHTLHPTELATAFGAYYRQETGEFDLLLTVLQSQRARNLSPDIARTLNGRLIAALSPIADAWKLQPVGTATCQRGNNAGCGLRAWDSGSREFRPAFGTWYGRPLVDEKRLCHPAVLAKPSQQRIGLGAPRSTMFDP